jgi:hypothetical protein
MADVVLVAVITTLGGIVGELIRRRSNWTKSSPRDQSKRFGVKAFLGGTLVGLAVAVAGLALWNSQGREPADLSIVFPKTGSIVSAQPLDVGGKWSGVNVDDEPRLVVYAPAIHRYFPQAELIDLEADGEWRSRVNVGSVGDSGATFDVLLVSNRSGRTETLDEYLIASEASGSWDGLTELPSELIRHDSITVTRR